MIGITYTVYFSRDLSMYTNFSPIGYMLSATLTSILPVSAFILNIELDGISLFPLKISSAIGLVLAPRIGSLYRYNATEAGSRHKYA